MGIALFDFGLFTVVVSAGLVAVALANPSPASPQTAWDTIEANALTPYAQLAPKPDSDEDRFIIKP